jgi:hypothetical protein
MANSVLVNMHAGNMYAETHIMTLEQQMGVMIMPATLRLSTEEQELLRQKCIKLNKKLIMADQRPVTESELAHIIIKDGVKCLDLDEKYGLRLGMI